VPPSTSSPNALKKLRLGELERRILNIANELGEFTLRDIRRELGIDRRRALDAVKRLVEKGFVEKLERGVYSVRKDKSTGISRGRGKDKTTGNPRRKGKDKTAGKSRRIGKDKSASGTRRIGKDKTAGEFRGLGKDSSSGVARRIVLASPIEEPRGVGKDKSAGDQFTESTEDRLTKPTEDQPPIPSGEAKDKVVQTAETGSHETPEFAPKSGDQEATPPASITTTTPGAGVPAGGSQRPPAVSDREIGQAREGVGGLWAGTGGFGFMVHRVVFGFGFGVLPHFVYAVFPGGVCREVRESGQLVCRDVVGRGRVVTFEFNVRSNGGLVFLEASENPLSVGEFLGFVDWYLLQVFRRLAGREVSRSEFVVKAAPHLNSDLPGAYLEGVKSITLQDYYDEVVRKYLKKINGETYTRVEVEAKSWVNSNLEDVVNGLVSYAKLPLIASRLEKLSAKLEEVVEGGLSGRRIAEAVKADLANLIYAFYLKIADVLINQFTPALAPEIGKAVREAVASALRDIEIARREHGKLLAEFKKLSEKVEKLAHENAELKRKLEEYELAQRQVTFDELPEEIKQLLKKLEDAGLIRAKHDRVEYGYAVWKAIHDYRGNIDYWLEEKLTEAIPEVASDYKLRRVVGATIKAIVHYDNKYGGKPGVPYALWLRKFEEHLKPLTLEQGLQAVREHLAKARKAGEEGGAESILDVLRKRLEEKAGKQGK